MKTVIFIKDHSKDLVNFDNISSIAPTYSGNVATMNSGQQHILFLGEPKESKQWFLWLDEQFKSLDRLKPRIAVLNYPDNAMDLSDFVHENTSKVE